MKLYLSSYRIPNITALQNLFDVQLKDVRVAHIPNAKDYYVRRVKNIVSNEVVTFIKSIGFVNVETIDLQDHRSEQVLKEKLQKFDLIWVAGGNTFCLREEMRKSGFENIIVDLLEEGVVYVGESAGSIVAGNSLKGIEFADNPEFAETVIWKGMNLLPHYILPHVGSESFGEAVEKAKELHADNSDVVELTDQQALVINGDSRQIVEGFDNATL